MSPQQEHDQSSAEIRQDWSEGYKGTSSQHTKAQETALTQAGEEREKEEKSTLETQRWLDFLWRVIIICIAAILLGSTAAVILGVFIGLANITPLITIFTASIALLGGLLAPSPIQEAIRAIADLRSASEYRRRSAALELQVTKLEEKLSKAQEELTSARDNISENWARTREQIGEQKLIRETLEANIRGLIAGARATGNNDVLNPDRLEDVLKELHEKYHRKLL